MQERIETPLQKDIVAILAKDGPLTRPQMVEKLQIARTTVYDSLVKLMARGLVVREPKHEGTKRGRSPVLFKLRED